ncbi:hypothetical protein [Tardiphaga sp.]|jgi:heme/copper-type cytochrome/quinol oxidase subunit 1|uniref:hypothetical protein n=1 Tax=Tardiphaga sp. TaxID=1926292 RepID=UPI0037D9DB09
MTDKSNVATLAAIIGSFIVALGFVFYMFPPWQVADDAAPKVGAGSMASLPVGLWWLGSLLLAISIIYAILNNRRKTPGQARATDDAARKLYEAEDRDAKRKGLG